MDLEKFLESLNEPTAPFEQKVLLALWYDGKGDWQKAHELVDQTNDLASIRIHAYLHRKEGDLWNADYWYKKAGTKRPDISLGEEWKMLVIANLEQV